MNEYQLAREAFIIGDVEKFERIVNESSSPLELRDLFIGRELILPASIPAVPIETAIESGPAWLAYANHLLSKGWPINPIIASIDHSTNRIMNYLHFSESNTSATYGLVIGYVQSGKTANFNGLIAKAIDAEVDLVIILAGLYNDLRLQTQARVEEEILTPLRASVNSEIKVITGADSDYEKGLISTICPNSTSIIVMKKNVSPLRKLNSDLRNISPIERSELKVLIIDDEADHASVNTKAGLVKDTGEGGELDSNAINEEVRKLIMALPRTKYIGYTATPYANVFVNSDDDGTGLGPTLYPRDFVLALPRPLNYHGLDSFFPVDAESEGHVVIIPEEEADEIRGMIDNPDLPPSIDLPPSLQIALMDHFLTLAMKRMRGLRGNHSMLIHCKRTKTSMKPILQLVRNLVQHWQQNLPMTMSKVGVLISNQFKQRWEEDLGVDSLLDWNELKMTLVQVLKKSVDIVEINSDSDDKLDYSTGLEKNYIAIGGDRLSRGLTLEGLTVSFFVRATNKYDTLMQMGRWFGFRTGFADLVRIYTTSKIAEWFCKIHEVDRELRDDIERYELSGYSPKEYGLRVLKHLDMKPTAKNKMRDVDEILTSLSMLPALFQSRVLPLDKPRSLFHNLNITANLLRELKQLGDATTVANSLLWENVSPSTISSFLRNYRLPEGNRGRTLPWITDQTENCPDDSWSVCLVGTRSSTRRAPFEHLKVGEDIKALEFGMPIRGRFPNSNSIGTVPGSFDFAIDLMHAGYHRNQFSTLSGGFSYTKMWAIRNHNNPILLIYVVDRNSDPTSMRTRGAKQPLFSADGPRIDTVALAIAYPGEHTNGHNSEYYIRSGAEPFPGGE